ncbi:MFS transporter [Pelagicoccus mobilis]|uniref:MFS transporter n=1 Tax=Pelagicoccus mobilis TaxID=415221 RepID=A0A934VQN8_9BACT|nr:MFS transporter [Pelagicoccus mobilis]MBK1878542.1 MFS transporter [Pelagicoccus mobilis]
MSASSSVSDTPSVKQSNARYFVLAAVFLSVAVNYMDRNNIAFAASSLQGELGFTNVQMGYIFSAFGWTYATLQIPGGILADRFSIRSFYTVCIALWSLATVAMGFGYGLATFVGLRILVGIFQAPSYPMNNRIASSWFPESERAGAIATYTSAQFLSLAFLAPAMIAAEQYIGWRGLFYVTGGIGVVFAVVWWFFYRNPEEHPMANEAELKYIEDGGGIVDRSNSETKKKGEPFRLSNLGWVLSQRKLWGIYLGQFGLGSTQIFFLTWFPKYLKDDRGINLSESWLVAAVPFLFAFLGVLLSGFTSDFLTRKGVSPAVARKTPVITGLLLSASIIGANFVDEPFWVAVFMSIAFFGSGLASIAWVFVSLLAPKNLLGLAGGTFNCIGGLSGIVTPVVIGYLAADGNFAPALIYIGVMTLLGAMSYVFLVGKVERLER